MKWFLSDLHLNHENLIKWERTQFANVQEHNEYIINALESWAEKKAKTKDELWFLGDFGDVEKLNEIHDAVRSSKDKHIKLVALLGNHDSRQDLPEFQRWFDEVYEYPVYISQRIVVSHEPVWPIAPFMVNVHGHTHAAELDSKNHITVSCNDVNYTPISEKQVEGQLGKLEPRFMKFLWEPYAAEYIFKDKSRSDIVCHPKTGKIDLPASRALQKIIRNDKWDLKNELKTP